MFHIPLSQIVFPTSAYQWGALYSYLLCNLYSTQPKSSTFAALQLHGFELLQVLSIFGLLPFLINESQCLENLQMHLSLFFSANCYCASKSIAGAVGTI